MLAERRARHRQRIRIGICVGVTVFIAAAAGLFFPGYHAQRAAPSAVLAGIGLPSSRPPQAASPTNAGSIPEESSPMAENTNWVQPDSTNLPDDVTLQAPTAAHDARPALRPHPPATSKPSQQIQAKFPASSLYVVKRGDTLARIAKDQGVTVKLLKAANHLKGDQIHTGEKLQLPDPRWTAVGASRR